MLISRKKHLKLRDLTDASYFCSIVGTCLTLNELRLIGRKAKLEIDPDLSDYDLHGHFVAIARDSRCHAHRILQKHLDKKYRLAIIEFSNFVSDDELYMRWKQAMESADVAGAYYALTTHPATSAKLQMEVFGDIHMLSHLSGASLRIEKQEYNILKQRVKKQARILLDKQQKIRQQDQRIKSMNQRPVEIERLKMQLKTRHAQLEEMRQAPAQLSGALEACSLKLDTVQIRAALLEKEVHKWKSKAKLLESNLVQRKQKFGQLQEQRDYLESHLAQILEPDKAPCGNSGKCGQMDLCGRCILYVGGRIRQKQHFRKLVEQYNGRFLYHDGGREDGDQYLYSILSQADTVMCPLDCISHEAMNKVKRYCDKTTKTLVMMPQSSLSAFSKGLAEIPVQ